MFPTVKEKLEKIQLADEDQFFECLQEFLRDLDQQELNSVFQAWMQRVQEVSQSNRDDVR
jgi:DNA-binding transcriptional regulator YbjK